MEQKPNTPAEQPLSAAEDELSKKLDAFAATQNPFPDQKQDSRAAYTPAAPRMQPQSQTPTPLEQLRAKAAKEAAEQAANNAGNAADAPSGKAEPDTSILTENEQPARKKSESGDGYTLNPATRKIQLAVILIVVLAVVFYTFVLRGGEDKQPEPTGSAVTTEEAAAPGSTVEF